MFLNGHIEVLIFDTVNGQITGSGRRLDTVISIETQNDCSHIGATCDIVVPLTCRIQNEGQYLIDNVRNLFKSGDAIFISAWYDQYLQKAGKISIFEGFIYDFLEGNPLTIRCLDNVYKLKQGVVNLNFESENSTVVLNAILNGTGITPHESNLEIDKVTASFQNMSPAACLEWLKTESKLTITLINDKLYMNIASNTVGEVKLKSDVNVIKCDMQKPDAAFQKFKVKAWIKKEDGTKEAVEIGDEDGQLRETKIFFLDHDSQTKNTIIDNSLENERLGNYTGKITTLLYPFCDLFWLVRYEDVRYTERNGKYTVRAITRHLTKEGFRNELTVAYLSEL